MSITPRSWSGTLVYATAASELLHDQGLMRDRVYVIIVNYRGADDVLECVGSLGATRYMDATVVIVDNGSSDGSVAELRRALPGIRVIGLSRNLGFGGGANVGIRHSLRHGASYIWLLNPDTTVEPDALGSMVSTLQRNPKIGIVGSRVLRGGSDPPRLWADGGVIDWERGGETSHRGSGEPVPAADGGIRSIDYATGASMLVRRDVFADVGLLPERYFLFFEETEFNVRSRRAGWEIVLDPSAIVVHNQRSHSTLPSPYYVYYFVRNRILFGRLFTDASQAELEDYARVWIEAWRKKVAARAPHWLGTFDWLVESGLEDARAGREGPRADISDIPHPGASRVR